MWRRNLKILVDIEVEDPGTFIFTPKRPNRSSQCRCVYDPSRVVTTSPCEFCQSFKCAGGQGLLRLCNTSITGVVLGRGQFFRKLSGMERWDHLGAKDYSTFVNLHELFIKVLVSNS